MVKILVSLIVAVTTLFKTVYLKRPVHELHEGWHPNEGSPGSVQMTWPCTGTEVFLERLSRLGPAKYRHA